MTAYRPRAVETSAAFSLEGREDAGESVIMGSCMERIALKYVEDFKGQPELNPTIFLLTTDVLRIPDGIFSSSPNFILSDFSDYP